MAGINLTICSIIQSSSLS